MQNARELDQSLSHSIILQRIEQNQSGVFMRMKNIDVAKQINEKDRENKFSHAKVMAIAEDNLIKFQKKNLPEKILYWVCEAIGIDMNDKTDSKLLRTSRQAGRHLRVIRKSGKIYSYDSGKNYVLARMCAAYLCCKHTNYTLSEISGFIAHQKKKDHSRTIHSRQKIKDLLKIKDAETMKVISFVEHKIKTATL